MRLKVVGDGERWCRRYPVSLHVRPSLCVVDVVGGEQLQSPTTRTHDLYIHPLYVLVSKILSSILNSPAPIHPLYHPLSTLSTVRLTCHFI
jgi:hypothetical protein